VLLCKSISDLGRRYRSLSLDLSLGRALISDIKLIYGIIEYMRYSAECFKVIFIYYKVDAL
jgi:hypothetical protein